MDADGGEGRKREACLVRKHREFKSGPETHAFPSSCSSFRAVPFPLRHKEERDPLPLLFIQECGTSWQAGFSLTVHSWEFPLWLFLSTSPVCIYACVFLLHYLCYQTTRPPTGRQGAVKRKPESALRSGGNCHTKCLTQLSHCEGILQLNIYKT